MAFTFGNIKTTAKKQVLNLTLVNALLKDASTHYASYSFPVVVLTDEAYNPLQVSAISKFLEANRITKYRIVSALNCAISKEQIKDDQKSGLVDFCRNNASNFLDYCTPGTVVITSGAALYAVTQADDIHPDHVTQRVFGVPYFWFSREQTTQGNWVFPIESFNDIFALGFSAAPVDAYKTKLAQFQMKAVLAKDSWVAPRYPRLTKHFVSSVEEFTSVVYDRNKHRKNEVLAWDLETSGLDFLHDRIGCITLTFDGLEGYYVPWKFVDKVLLGKLLANNIQLGANLKFDIKFLWQNGVPEARVDEDCNALGHVMDETRANSLKALAYYYSEYGGYDFALDEYKRRTKIDNYLDVPEELLREYAIMDAIVTWRVFARQMRHIKQLDAAYPNEKGTGWTMEDYYRKIRIRAINLYAAYEYRGVYIDVKKLDKVQAMLKEQISQAKLDLAAAFGVPKYFDFGSTTALGRLLEERGWEDLGRSKSGVYSCGDEQLARWKKLHPEASLIQNFRSLNVFLKTFVGDAAENTGWRPYIHFHPEDGTYRIHANYTAMGTESGRTRCSNPNLMNIPTHGDLAKEVKKCFCTKNDDEYYIMTVDYAALQMRLATIDSGDPVLSSIFSSGKKVDIHSKTATNVFVQGRKFDITTVEVEQDGKVYKLLGGQVVKTANRGEVAAIDLTEEDTLSF
jgi:DNA polymerase I-like protein with 3'-5' exonuclease and polymerase domains